jgi:hypothetical protein
MAPLLVGGLVAGAGQFTAGAALTGLATAGILQSGEASAADAESRQNIANFNAQVQRQEAVAKRTATRFASKRQAKSAARTKGTLETRIAAAGGAGSPVAIDLAAEQASELELENLLIGFEGEVAATQAERQAELDIASGKIARKRGSNLQTASRIQAGTTLLKGFN